MKWIWLRLINKNCALINVIGIDIGDLNYFLHNWVNRAAMRDEEEEWEEAMLPGNKRRESPHCNSRLMHINCVYYTMESIDSHILGDKWQRARIKFPFPFQDFLSFAHVEKPSHIVSSFLFTAQQIAHSFFLFFFYPKICLYI